MKRRKTFLTLAGFLACGGLILLVVGLHKTITLIVDGKAQTISTWAWRVDQVLQTAGTALGPYDELIPSLEARLVDGDTITLDHASSYQIAVDGKSVLAHATNPIPANLLSDAGIEIYPGDQLFEGGLLLPNDIPQLSRAETHFWQLQRTANFQVRDGSQELNLFSIAATVGQALWQAGIVLSSADRVTPSPDEPLVPGMKIQIIRARPALIQTALGEFQLLSAGKTTGEVLLDSGFSLQGLDYTIPNENAPVPEDGKIRLIRVREEFLIEQTPVPFESDYQPVADLEIDRQTIVEAGQYGILAERIRIRYEDGQEISRKSEDQWLAQEPVTQIMGYGTQIVMRSIQTGDGTVEYWRALQVYATSYKPSDTGSNITATGKILKKGIIGVNPRYIPYGTILYVEGYGYGEAADTGNIGPRWIDLGYTDEDFVGWHRNVTVYFVWPPPEKIVWIIP